MAYQTVQPSTAEVWALARRQHGVVARGQLLELGFHPLAITHRLATGRLHPVRRGIYAVGRPELTRQGRWMAAVLACGPQAALSHESAASLWEILPRESSVIEVSVPEGRFPRPPGIVVHRRRQFGPSDLTRRHAIPVTTPARTLLDLATRRRGDQLEAAINQADKLGLIDPEALRVALLPLARRPGAGTLRRTLDRRTFSLTDSKLERRFLPLVREAGLPRPETGRHVNGFKVDFYWPDLGLVVETDGLRYHRTPGQQARDRLRDQAHAAAGMTALRFTHAQVMFEPGHVRTTLAAVTRRLRAGRPRPDRATRSCGP